MQGKNWAGFPRHYVWLFEIAAANPNVNDSATEHMDGVSDVSAEAS